MRGAERVEHAVERRLGVLGGDCRRDGVGLDRVSGSAGSVAGAATGSGSTASGSTGSGSTGSGSTGSGSTGWYSTGSGSGSA